MYFFCYLIQKSKLSYILDSLHTNWTISRVYLFVLILNSYDLQLRKITNQYQSRFNYALDSSMEAISLWHCWGVIEAQVALIAAFNSSVMSNQNQIKSLLLSHHHSTCALVSEILESVLQTVQKKQFTYRQYILTDCTEDNVQNTHT